MSVRLFITYSFYLMLVAGFALPNGAACFKKCKQLFEYQHLRLLRDIWWSKL